MTDWPEQLLFVNLLYLLFLPSPARHTPGKDKIEAFNYMKEVMQ